MSYGTNQMHVEDVKDFVEVLLPSDNSIHIVFCMGELGGRITVVKVHLQYSLGAVLTNEPFVTFSWWDMGTRRQIVLDW